MAGQTKRIVVVGAGIGGLSAALELAHAGLDVTVVEKAAGPGGKMRRIDIGGSGIDAGPTVFTMRWVFDALFDRVGANLDDELTLTRASVLARHAWNATDRLDLFADIDQSAEAIGRFAGAAEARRFLDFSQRAKNIYRTLEGPFIRAAEPNPISLATGAGLKGLGDLWRISPFTTLWRALGDHFHDPRLRQLFGRYATYCGSSPFEAPATLMLVAHVEQDGVWLVDGGMHRIAQVLAAMITARGGRLRYGAEVGQIVTHVGGATGVRLVSGELLPADAVIVNADVAALGAGRFGPEAARAVPQTARATRSLSAITWAMHAEAAGFPLSRHNVFFSGDYAAEFADIFRHGRVPAAPTVYVCAQARGDDGDLAHAGPEPLLCLVNAPPNGDTHRYDPREIAACEARTFDLLTRCGLVLRRPPETTVVTTPADFERYFPATGGALYGQASHGWTASFTRPTARTRLPGLYLAGGSTHPGPGVPMAAISGYLAAQSVMADLTSPRPSLLTATRGGTSMR